MVEPRLSDLLDMSIIQKLADSNFRASGLPMTIVDAIDGAILVRAGWPGICTYFHRAGARSQQQCRASDDVVKDHLDAEAHQYRCNNGLWHIAMPIVVAGRHLATLFLTQFWFDSELVNREYFVNQGRKFEYDLDSYLAALDKIPVFSSEKVDYIVDYDKALVRFIADLAEQSLRFIEAQSSLVESEKKYRTLVDNVNVGVHRTNPSGGGRFIQVNPALVKMFGYGSAEELMLRSTSDLYERPDDRRIYHEELQLNGFVKDLELVMKKKDGTSFWCSITASAQYNDAEDIQWIDSVFEDVTERKNTQINLQKSHDELEMRVVERTADLAEVNRLLMIEVAERKRFEKKLRELSEIDHLTRIYNRRKLFEIMELEIEKSRRYLRPLSLIIMDIDHFKKVNDAFGHNIGDNVLRATADVVGAMIRKVDVFARYGGEEFIVLCPETGIDGAVALAEKIRIAIEEFSHPAVGKVTVSAGVAERSDENDGTVLIEKADGALYAAKKQGRNRVTVAGSGLEAEASPLVGKGLVGCSVP